MMFGYWRNPFRARTSFAFFALHKSGSSFVHTMLHRIYCRMKYQYVSELPIDSVGNDTYYGPVRLFDELPSDLFSNGKSILQVRDPRDILTSLYFSLRYSHTIPAGDPRSFLTQREKLEEIGIDEFVLQNVDALTERFLKFEPFLNQKNVLVLRYESMVNDFDRWFDQIIEFSNLKWNFKLRCCLNSLREEADFSVDREDVTQHKRQVTPGDYRRKLLPETIESLNHCCNRIFELFYGGELRHLIEPSEECELVA